MYVVVDEIFCNIIRYAYGPETGTVTVRVETEEDRTEIYHTGQDPCLDPDRLISESNSGNIFHDENGLPVCTFSMTMESPAWTLVRKVSMENYERVINRVRVSICILGGVVLLVALVLYEAWLRRFMRQFSSLLKGIVRMGEGDLESTAFEPTGITEFKQMQREINRTSAALSEQMDTIRRMEREQMELENEGKTNYEKSTPSKRLTFHSWSFWNMDDEEPEECSHPLYLRGTLASRRLSRQVGGG